ncbi:hypothetical protein CBER1_06603 [Cercospora berteroae]|uniref:Pyruvate carboxylase n=1 Tax=Cercospora berteroae TaxID=357750 RepID=A0A2S6BUI6_9PEZI|nr:hypothetical protein CBER1_06603 [Cercospora berteroae]
MAPGRIEPRPIKKILVANRGEIAARVLSSCRELNLKTYSVYTENDALHTYNASYAIKLRSPASYMNIEELLSIVQEHKIDAVHPGYGFLSESPDLAARMAEIDVMVVGPGAENLDRTGDKLQARQLAEECDVPGLPAFTSPTGNVEDVRAFAEKNGLPVMIKAVDGGGGRGIRLVRKAEDLEGLVKRAIEESPSKQVFAEKAAVDGFRHVERRYQKIVELAPSMCEDREVVEPVIEAAVRIAKKVKYASLGTFEFLLNSKTREFFFLEINPGLQVEHTITESICSIDIVKAQLRLAQGASCEQAGLDDLAQDPLQPPKQHSIQLRVTAEDPEKNYSLSIGKISSFNLPSGVGTRVDTALVPGASAIVSSDFDSVVAKIIITARTWPDAVSKARRALQDTYINGIRTNIALLRAIVSHHAFENGECDTTWLESHHEELLTISKNMQDPSDPFHGLVQQSSGTSSAQSAANSSGSTTFRKDDAWTIDIQPQGSKSQEKEQQPHHLHLTKILKNDFPTTLSAEILYTTPNTQPLPFTITLKSTSASGAAMSSNHPYGSASNPSHIIIPLSGKLVEVLVDAGDLVNKDETICVIKQMKMEIEVRSHRKGIVTWVTEAEDDEDVAVGMLAAVVEDERVEAKL